MLKLGYNHTIAASCIGYVTQAIVNNFVTLLFLIFQSQYGIDIEKITLLIAVNFTVQLLVDFLSAKFVNKIGYRKCIIAAHIFAALGIGGLAVFPSVLPSPYIGLLFSVILYAIGGGLTEVLISPIVEACPTNNKSSVMSMLHSFYCWGSVAVIAISTLFFYYFGKEKWQILALLWTLIPLFNAFFFSKVPIEQLTEEGDEMPVRELASQKIFWVLIVLIFVSGASELAMSQWASSFAEKGLGISKTAGDLMGPCLFSVLMGSSRLFYAKYSDKINLLGFIAGSGIVCIISYLTAAFSPSPVIALAGCGLCGLSVGVLWPGVFSIASAKFPKGGTALFALMALAGDLGCSSGPALVGIVSGAFGENLKAGLCSAVIFPVLLIIFAQILKKNHIESKE